MSRKIAKLLSAMLLALAIAVTQIPVSDAQASVVASSDFQTDGTKLLRYTGTAQTVSVPDGIKEIGEEAFSGNDDLIQVDLGDQVEKIDYRAFADCGSLRTVRCGNGVQDIGMGAFSNDTSLVNVSLGDQVKDIGSGAFAGCSSLKSVDLSAGNTYLSYSNGVIYDDEQKIIYALLPGYEKEAFTLPSTVEEIKAYAFWGNPYLSYVKLDSALTNIPAYAFSNCMNLQEVSIPLPVRTIEADAFQDCVNLTKVNLPESVNNIHDTAFDGCSKVEFETVPGTYGATYAADRKASQADNVEYEETGDTQVVSPDAVTGNADTQSTGTPDAAAAQPSASPSATVPPEVHVVQGSYNSEKLLGESSIVAGKAVVFIDNKQSDVVAGNNGKINLQDAAASDNGEGDSESLGSVLAQNAEKGKDFPKYTVVGDKIASKAYYQDGTMESYTIDDGIREIGEFAFARSALKEIQIPDGVTAIGYGAFYHCDSLTDVSIPDSVTQIEGNAFAKTPWIQNAMRSSASYPYLVVGDGILLAYDGNDSVVNIPAGVKRIALECFRDHMGITAVNLPDSLIEIGENAFAGCKNLKTVNGGKSCKAIDAGAFQDCPLSKIVIPASVESIGIAAFDSKGGTDTVTFEGDTLPVMTLGSSAERLSMPQARNLVFSGCKTAIVSDQITDLTGTVLENGTFGMKGSVRQENQNTLAELTGPQAQTTEEGVSVRINSSQIRNNGADTMATMPGNDGSYLLTVEDSDDAAAKIAAAYGELYGGVQPSDLKAFDISLKDSTGQIPIKRLGRQYMTIQIPVPDGLSTDDLHLVTLDEDGQLEAAEFQVLSLEDGDYIQFTARHFSPYGMYHNSKVTGQGKVINGSALIGLSGNKDDTPDTGDYSHPKWAFAAGLFFASVALFFYRGNEKRKKK